MAVLTDVERLAVSADIQQKLSSLRESIGLTKQQLKDAIDATDQWIEDNQASFNTALPLPARTTLTAAQKTRLFYEVAKRRFGGT